MEPETIEIKRIEVSKLVDLVGDPFCFSPWTHKPINKLMVMKKAKLGDVETSYSPDNKRNCPNGNISSRMYHTKRISYFLENKDELDNHIEIEVNNGEVCRLKMDGIDLRLQLFLTESL